MLIRCDKLKETHCDHVSYRSPYVSPHGEKKHYQLLKQEMIRQMFSSVDVWGIWFE